MTDEDIKQYIYEYKKNHNRIFKKSFSNNVLKYLENRFHDSDSISETIYRIINNIEIRPICITCGNKVKFKNINYGFYKHCSNSCAQKDINIYSKIINTKFKKYGSKNNFNKIKESLKIKYGVEFALQRKESQLKAKQTCLERYGDENYRNIEKTKQTCLNKYNTEYYLISNDCKEKTIKKFGVDNYRKTDECKQLVSTYQKEHKKELQEKKKQTYLEKYGVDNPMKSNIIKNKFDWNQQKLKEYKTKKKNNSFNTSISEDQSYNLLKEKYPDVKRQYRSELYPFNCDFYIPSLNLYIECQYGQFHHKRPYIGNEQDLKDIELLKEKADRIHKQNNVKLSRYDVELDTWTIRDVKKRNVAKQNNLNYIEFWNIEELKNWLDKQNEI